MRTPGDHPLLAVEKLSKSFPGVKANDDVTINVGHGEIHALLGDNGAGTSTLVANDARINLTMRRVSPADIA